MILRGQYPTRPLPQTEQDRLRRMRNVELLREHRQRTPSSDDSQRREKRRLLMEAMRAAGGWVTAVELERATGMMGPGACLVRMSAEGQIFCRTGYRKNRKGEDVREYLLNKANQ